MKKVININFQGRILPIEELAYENLKNYIETLRSYFEKEEGKDEIINDIECRVAELCEDRLKKGAVCITEDDINLIIESIGRPADFEAQDGFEAQSSANNSSDASYENESYNHWDNIRPKRLYRDEHNKVLGGVCSGIANYFGLEPLLVRILWIFLIGVNILGYLILWIAVPSSSVKEVGGVKKRLFRDIENKVIGGVCAGLSKYFGIKVWIIRILFLIPFIRLVFNFREIHLFQFWDAPDFPNFLDITFSPGSVFIYIVLWLVLPEAKTSADKLEMVGEKVDLNSIKNTIQNDMEGFSKRAKTWGNDFYAKSRSEKRAYREERREERNEQREPKRGFFHFIGRVITICIKAFVYFILGIIGISLLAALFGIGVAATAVMPLRKFLLEDGAQTWSVYGALLFFVWVPILGIVAAVIRKLAGYKKANVWVRSSFVALWIVGWILLFYFGSSLGHSFSKHNVPEEQTVSLVNPGVDYLEVTASPKMKYYQDRWFQISPFDAFSDEDTVFVRNLRIRIVQSKTDSFQVKVVKLSNGKTVQNANDLASKINFDLTQQDSLVYLHRGIAINKKDKFRNQHIIMTIAVPVGKRIKITNKGWSQTNVRINGRGMHTETFDRISSDEDWYDEWNEPWDNESFSYDRGVEYKMTTTGLEKIKRDDDAEDQLNNDDQDPDEMEQRLEELKKEREALEKNLEKNREEKLKELEKIDKALEKQKKDINKSTQKIAVSVDRSDIKERKLPNVAGKLTDINWVLERFTY